MSYDEFSRRLTGLGSRLDPDRQKIRPSDHGNSPTDTTKMGLGSTLDPDG